MKPEEEKEADLGDANYDEFSGYSGSLFQKGSFDKDDDDADRIYDLVDARMETRRKKARDAQEKLDIAKMRAETPNLTQQFSDLKRELGKLSEEEWMQLPGAQERLKAKRVKKESYSNIPDQIIMGGGGMSLPPGMPGASMTDIGDAKKAVLAVSLDKEASSVGVDPEGYLSDMISQSASSMAATGAADIAEVKKARLLFKSVTKSDPTNATGWIAAARLEEVSGNLPEAKALIARALGHCPQSEDLWLTAVRLEPVPDKAKSIVANGIRQIPKSVKLWTEAANQEEKTENKIRVFQKALEIVPTSVQLWKQLINLTARQAEALLLLARAVECCPTSEELWLTYAKLSDFQAAQKILNEARRTIPTSVSIWISAAELAESMGADERVLEGILGKAIDSLAKNGVVVEKRGWIELAVKCNSTKTPGVLASVVIKRWVESDLQVNSPKDVKHALFADYEFALQQSGAASGIVAESILHTAVTATPLSERKGIWIKLISRISEKKSENVQKLQFLYENAVKACSHSEVLWLMWAKFLWVDTLNGTAAREVLKRAMEAIDDSEDIYIAAVKLEETVSTDGARSLLSVARSKCPTSCRLWIKSAQLERGEGKTDAVMEICGEAIARISKNPDLFKLWTIGCHALMEAGRLEEAKEWISRACDAVPTKPAVWLVAADVAIAEQDCNRARSILERGRNRLAGDENLWYKGFIVEELGAGPTSPSARVYLSRALQACPNSGLLWSCAIASEPVATRHPKCLDALKRCPENPLVVGAVAKFFWIEKLQLEKARKWFLNAIQLDGGFGEVWADYFAFEVSQGDENAFNVESAIAQLAKLDAQTVNKGLEWNQFRKRVDNWRKSLMHLVTDFVFARYPHIAEGVGKSPVVAAAVSEALAQSISSKV